MPGYTVAVTRQSEPFARIAGREGAVAFSFEVAVPASERERLIAEGRRLWLDRWHAEPLGWADEDFIRHAISSAVEDALLPEPAGEAGER